MTARAEFDVGPLSWVKGEIDHAIQRAQEALRAFAANSSDTAQLRSSQSHLHQAHGALSIVGLDGITRLSEELESLLAGMENEASLRKAEIFRLAERAFDGVLAYLDQLMAGNPNQPLRLYPVYRDLVAERLMREVLYYVARARPASERVREVQEAYHLSQTIPAAGSDGAAAAELPALKSAREHLTHAKEAWNKFASGNPPSLLAFRDSSGALKDSAGQLGNVDLAALAGEVAGLAAWLTSNREKMCEAVA